MIDKKKHRSESGTLFSEGYLNIEKED